MKAPPNSLPPSSSSSVLMSLKAANQSKSIQQRIHQDRHRDCLVLILHYLRSCGYIHSATQLQNESGSGSTTSNNILSRYEVADNMDLNLILSEYVHGFQRMHGKAPKLTRKISVSVEDEQVRFEKRKQAHAALKRRSSSSSSSSSSSTPIVPSSSLLQQQQTPYPNSMLPKIPSSSPPPQKQPSQKIKSIKEASMERNNNCDNKIIHSQSYPDSLSKTSSSHSCSLLNSIGLTGTKLTNNVTMRSHPISSHNHNHNHNHNNKNNNNNIIHYSPQENNHEDSHPNMNHYSNNENGSFIEETILKPLPDFGGDVELKALARNLQRDILQQSPNVHWDDVIELEDAKRILKEAVIMPIKYPQLFTGSALVSPWRGILLFGPPGNGKTLLAKTVATQCETTFFNISSSSIVSKFRGDSEKLVRVLFELARHYAPSTIFLDEIDAIMGHRGGGGGNYGGSSSMSGSGGDSGGGEHEGSRRMKTELLVQMDGILSNSQRIFVLAASNLPWDLDNAFLRRLEKRIFVPLPNEAARKCMMQQHFASNHILEHAQDLDLCAKQTQNYSGSDIKLLCKEIAMRPIRRILQQLEELEISQKEDPSKQKNHCYSNLNDTVLSKKISRFMKQNIITSDDILGALKCTKSSSDRALCSKYKEWAGNFGSV